MLPPTSSAAEWASASTPRAYPDMTASLHLATSSPHAYAALSPWLEASREPQIPIDPFLSRSALPR